VSSAGDPVNKLSVAERRRVLEVLTSDRFVDLAPLQIYAQLLDEGVYLCSVSTMYRALADNTLVAERRRLARHPTRCARNWSRPRHGKCFRGTSPSSRVR
jgi:putative transposase